MPTPGRRHRHGGARSFAFRSATWDAVRKQVHMAQTGRDSAVEALPYEIKLAVVAYLVPPPAATASSFRRNAALTAFACASPVLYAELAHLLNADFVLRDRTFADKFVDAAPQRVRDQVRTLTLHGSAADPAQVDALTRSVTQLSKLRLQGTCSVPSKRQLVESLRPQPQLRVLEVDFGGGAGSSPPRPPHASSPRSTPPARGNSPKAAGTVATLPWNARADSPRPVPGAAVVAAAAALAPSAASDGSGGCSAQDGSRTSLSLKSRVCAACYAVECERTSCLVRASLEICPLLAELRLVHALASAPCEPRDRSLSSSTLPCPSSAAALQSLCLHVCALSAADLVDLLSPSLRRLELLRCPGVSTSDIADALETSQTRLRHFAYEAPLPAVKSPSSSPRPAAQAPPTSPSSSASTSPIMATIGAVLPHLGHLESLDLIGDVLSAAELASLPQHVPALQRLCITANRAISLHHLASLVTRPAPARPANLRRLEYEPRPERPPVWCDGATPPRSAASGGSEDTSHAVEVLWKTSLALDLTLVGSPFRNIQERFSWATGAVEKARSRVEDEGGEGVKLANRVRRRKRPSLAGEA